MRLCVITQCGVSEHAKDEDQKWRGQALQEDCWCGLKHKHAFKSHILTKMTTKRKRQLRGTSMLNKSDVARVERSLRLR